MAQRAHSAMPAVGGPIAVSGERGTLVPWTSRCGGDRGSTVNGHLGSCTAVNSSNSWQRGSSGLTPAARHKHARAA